MTWSCATLPADQIHPRPLGYSISLEDLGCYGSPVQDIIFRVVNRGGVERLTVELYGMPRVDFAVPLQNGPNGKNFDYQLKGVSIQGVVKSHGPTQALIKFDEMDLNSIPFCSTGTYTIPVLSSQ